MWFADEATETEYDLYKSNNSTTVTLTNVDFDDSLNKVVDLMTSKMAADTHDTEHKGRQFETVARFRNSSALIGNMTQVYCKGIPVPQINCEIAIPLTQFSVALERLSVWSQTEGHELH